MRQKILGNLVAPDGMDYLSADRQRSYRFSTIAAQIQIHQGKGGAKVIMVLLQAAKTHSRIRTRA
jgi:hypothetical protein